jgi:hypothetical protein
VASVLPSTFQAPPAASATLLIGGIVVGIGTYLANGQCPSLYTTALAPQHTFFLARMLHLRSVSILASTFFCARSFFGFFLAAF